MQTTDYFRNDVMLKRPCIKAEWVELALSNPVRREFQSDDGRIRHWVWIDELTRYLRVVTLEDGVTVQMHFQIGDSRHENFIRQSNRLALHPPC